MGISVVELVEHGVIIVIMADSVGFIQYTLISYSTGKVLTQ